ncbi:hypothetical protein ALC53_13094 [Atta colombica]|uniref:Uncharacterized protein n=1 Tax=Atta colombica TaxID=520822 RepID=A0A151HYF5_9HYME|nr:hypothetical protein ALC53_13094 [Atta colombica]
MNEAKVRILRLLQSACLFNKIRENRIVNLNPFFDLIRVGGRLQVSNLPFSQKHPILFPSRHSLTDSIIREIYENHTGNITPAFRLLFTSCVIGFGYSMIGVKFGKLYIYVYAVSGSMPRVWI